MNKIANVNIYMDDIEIYKFLSILFPCIAASCQAGRIAAEKMALK